MVKFNGQLSRKFIINNELKRGDAQLPILFNIALNEKIKNVINTGVGVKHQYSKSIKQLHIQISSEIKGTPGNSKSSY